MEYFDKRMALDVIEDALMDMDTPHGRGVAAGLCGAFHMCGLINTEEWEALLERIPAKPRQIRPGGISVINGSTARRRGQFLN